MGQLLYCERRLRPNTMGAVRICPGTATNSAMKSIHVCRIALVLAALCLAPACRAQAVVYAFVDDQGELHLSNVPDSDSEHYQRLDASPVQAGAGANIRSRGVARSRRPYDTAIAQAAEQYGIEPALLHAVIVVESGYDPNALSKRGAAGLMQLMPGTARRYGVLNPFDPAENVRGGAQYLSDLLKRFDNDLRLALAAYNAGEGAVATYGGRIPPFRETAAYVPKVVAQYLKLRTLM
jgi:soluble lytic murein transglycosylase-like protein